MRSSEQIEDVLEHLGSEWPDDTSIVDRVMCEVHSAPIQPVISKRRRILMKSILAIAASLVACVALWWGLESNQNSLYAQVIDAARKAQTIHITHYIQLKRETEPRKIFENWYEKGVGFRRDVYDNPKRSQHTISMGNEDSTWTLAKDRNKTVVRSHGKGILNETEQIFTDIDLHAKNLQNNCQRCPENDRVFNGKLCTAYILKTDKRRQLFYLDPELRLVRVESQEQDDHHWNTTQFNTIAYDELLGLAWFQPHFGKDFKIVDADAKPEKPEPTRPEGPILIYEADPISKSASRTASDWDRLLKAIDMRLNGGTEKLAVVRKLDDRRIEVTLMRKNDTDRQHVERQLARPGTLEFRLLANNHVDKALIDRAVEEPTKTEVLDPSGKRLAWWVPVKAGEEKSFAGHKDIARRTKKQDNHDITEILVVADPYNLTSAYLTQTKLQFDRLGNPAVNFTFNDAGGELLGKLTGEHLPNDSTGLLYKLGIIIDGELFSAPAIQSKIGKEGEITGSFTEIEVLDLAAVLNAGSLPVRLRLVEENPRPH